MGGTLDLGLRDRTSDRRLTSSDATVLFYSQPEDDRQAHGGQAEGDSAEAATANACVGQGHGEVAVVGGAPLLPVPRRPGQPGAEESVPS